jgi:hypothetical protein
MVFGPEVNAVGLDLVPAASPRTPVLAFKFECRKHTPLGRGGNSCRRPSLAGSLKHRPKVVTTAWSPAKGAPGEYISGVEESTAYSPSVIAVSPKPLWLVAKS